MLIDFCVWCESSCWGALVAIVISFKLLLAARVGVFAFFVCSFVEVRLAG